jgi:O-antigen ligase/tetratricopeptide (TPR) repeat protein
MTRTRVSTLLAGAIEALVAALALGSVWPFGSVHAFVQAILLAGIGLVLALWAARVAVEGRPIWRSCALVACAAAFCCVPALQTMRLAPSAVEWLSPATAESYRALRPSAADEPLASDARIGNEERLTLSFDAGATRKGLLRLIGLAALFAAIRNNLAGPGSATRFAWWCVANGVLLATVGLGQMTSSPANVVFWMVPTEGQVFGPFVCRNHAAYVLNLAVGCALGLLMGSRCFAYEGARDVRARWTDLIREPRVAWLLCALGVLAAGLTATLSRGGMLGLLLGAAMGLAALGGGIGRRLRWAIVPAAVIALAFLGFSGFDRVGGRWEKLVDDNVSPESRAAVWARTFPLVGRFPVWGTGWDTFMLVEPLTRQPGDPYRMAHQHAHNDLLQLWIEGGTAQLAIAVILLFLVFRCGFVAVVHHRHSAVGPLAAGTLVGLTAVVLHSFVDFGLHVPSIALLTTVMAAYLTNLANAPVRVPHVRRGRAGESTLLLRGVAVAQFAGLILVAIYLARVGWRQQESERYRLAAAWTNSERKIAYLAAASALTPDQVEPRIEWANAHAQRAEQRAHVLGALAEWTVACNGANDFFQVLGGVARRQIDRPLAADDDFRAACKQIAIACRLSPLEFEAQERLRRAQVLAGDHDAAYRSALRLTRLAPAEPEPWFLVGNDAFDRGELAAAVDAWRTSMTASPHFLPEILRNSGDRLADAAFRERLMPDEPAVLLEAAQVVAQSAPSSDLSEIETAFLRRAAQRLESRPRTPEQNRLLSQVRSRLGDGDAALAALQAAVEAQPTRASWRFEYAQLLHRSGQARRAESELSIVLTLEPNNWPAKSLYDSMVNVGTRP